MLAVTRWEGVRNAEVYGRCGICQREGKTWSVVSQWISQNPLKWSGSREDE